MIERYHAMKEDRQSKIEIKKSRFICSPKRVESEDQAKSFIREIKKEHQKVNHNCSAFITGEKNEIQRSSDDGEPSGTADVPMLEVLKKNQLINVAAVVIRYFGGTKLGTGGLVQAYTHTISQALSDTGIVEGTLQQEISAMITYPQLGKLQSYLELQHFFIKEIQYTGQVNVVCAVDEKSADHFRESIIELLNGQVRLEGGPVSYHEQLVTDHI